MTASADERTAKVLYVAAPGEPDAASALRHLIWFPRDIATRTVAGGSAALEELRSTTGYVAVVLGPNLPPEDSARVVAALEKRRDISLLKLVGDADRSLFSSLETLKVERDRLLESQGFERAMREHDRATLASLRQTLTEERKRSGVLEATLRRTEDELRDQGGDIEHIEGEARETFEEQLTAAADRLHAIASQTQLLQTELEQQVATEAADRDRLSEQTLFGYAVFTREGVLLRCSPSFAQMFGYSTPEAAVESSRGRAFPRLPDHVRVIDLLETGRPIERASSTARRLDGQPFRVLMSASFLGRGTTLIERMFVDVSEFAELEAELRLARRLEAAGRLAAEMAPEIEALLPLPGDERISHDRLARAVALVQHLLSYSQHQAKPAGFLSIPDAIRRAEPLLRSIAGRSVELRLALSDVDAVVAGEDDIEHLLVELVFAAAALLPSGGGVTLETASITTDLVLNTQVSATAAGYGVLPVSASSSLVRTAARCGGTVRTSGEAGRTSTLHVVLPC
jgi:PAS domain-containing protein